MTAVRLVQSDPAIDQALADDPAYADAMARQDWPRLAEAVQRRVGPMLSSPGESAMKLHWGSYFAVAAGELVGSCAFKTPPTEAGVVEIAYFTYPGFEGRGYATAMARQLIDLAAASSEVRRIVAHTLPEASASTRLLVRVGMVFAGEVVDPDDGPVWQWHVQVRE